MKEPRYRPSVEHERLGHEKVGSGVRFQDGVTEEKRCRLPLSHQLLPLQLRLLLLAWPWPSRWRRGGSSAERWSEFDDDGIAHVVRPVDTRPGQVTPRTSRHKRRKRAASFRPAESVCAPPKKNPSHTLLSTAEYKIQRLNLLDILPPTSARRDSLQSKLSYDYDSAYMNINALTVQSGPK